MGGQQLLEWAVQEPDLFENIIPIATNAYHSPWGIAFNEAQRMALRADQTLTTKQPNAGQAGLEAARAIAMLSYRHYRTYVDTQTGLNSEQPEDFKASSYQRYQGNKLWKRFSPLAYYALGRGMDSHHLGRGKEGKDENEKIAASLQQITAKSLVIGIDTDILFPLEEQGLISRHIPNSRFEVINADYGHDGFLTETRQIGDLLANFLQDTLRVDAQTKHAFTDGLTGRKFALPGTEDV